MTGHDADWAAHLGLCSVTLRGLPPAEVIVEAGRAGLSRIEWGADVHAPAANAAGLAELGEQTRAAGLAVASYGSYWFAGVSATSDVEAVLDGAVALGAPRVRVWAGGVGTAEADDAVWDNVVSALRTAADLAADRDLELALEFHFHTLTDTVPTTIELLDRVGSEHLRTYWQPRLDEPADAALRGLEQLLPHVAAVHVFSWWPEATRLPLAARTDLWSGVVDLLTRAGSPRDLLLEFVEDDDPQALVRDAADLRALLDASQA